MSIEITDYVNVKDKALSLGMNIPDGMAFLPRNFHTANSKEELVHESSVPTLRALFREEGVWETRVEKEGEKIPNIQENAFQWVGPILFFGSTLILQNPVMVSIAINIISNYLSDWFKGTIGNKKVILDFVVEQPGTGSHKHIHYEGDILGLEKLPDIIYGVGNNEKES